MRPHAYGVLGTCLAPVVLDGCPRLQVSMCADSGFGKVCPGSRMPAGIGFGLALASRMQRASGRRAGDRASWIGGFLSVGCRG